MSLQIIKPGLLDTIQDTGRYGFQHLGINPTGVMDPFSAQLANALLGKDLNSAVIEMHFPAAHILFEEETIICLTGADFSPTINRRTLPLGQPVAIPKNSILQFEKKIAGARCYLSVIHHLALDKWLNSYSTHLIAAAGGFNGRPLKKGDTITFTNNLVIKNSHGNKPFTLLPWKATENISLKKEIRFITGNEWDWLTENSTKKFTGNKYHISNNSNRMGYRLKGNALRVKEDRQLISSGVTFGTIQLLPDGQLIVLMADHQTTGGYPRIAHVISADLPLLAQSNAGDEIRFSEVEHSIAEQALLKQLRELRQVLTASKFKIEKLQDAAL